MITLKDLKEYDVKNIDAGKLLKTIQQRKDILANIALIMLTLMILNNITTKERIKTQALSQKVLALEKKNKAIDAYKKSNKTLKDVIKALPQGLPEADGMIQAINSLAINQGLQIISFTPGERTENEIYRQTNLRLSIANPDYKKLVSLTDLLERSSHNLRIEHWSAKIEQKRTRSLKLKNAPNIADQEEAPPLINTEMEISSIFFPYEK